MEPHLPARGVRRLVRPAAFEGGFSPLAAKAHRVKVAGVDVLVADLDDVVRSKEAAGRPKDWQVLPALYRHQAGRNSPGEP